MKAKTITILFAFLFILVISSSIILNNKYISNKQIPDSKGGISGKVIEKDNLVLYLENQEVINDLPKDARINLRLYNFNSGERQFEGEYKITRSGASSESFDDPELTIILHSKYLENLDEDICMIINKARENGDLEVNLHISKALFFWRYRNILDYEECVE